MTPLHFSLRATVIIPYQELLGNYDKLYSNPLAFAIIPYQELLGNYDFFHRCKLFAQYYTIPRAIRELWPFALIPVTSVWLYHTKSY